MSLTNKTQAFQLLIFSIILLLGTLSQAACSSTQQAAAETFLGSISNRVDDTLSQPTELVFSGQIVNDEGEWQNGYVVILFKDDQEVTRAVSGLRNSALTPSGPMDGVFELRIKNEYELTEAHPFYYTNEVQVEIKTVPGLVATQYLGAWLGKLNPKDLRIIKVPDKQVNYTIVVLDMKQETLPETHLPGRLAFDVDTGEMHIDVNASSNVPKFTSLANASSDSIWQTQMSGFSGTAEELWQLHLSAKVQNMSLETFLAVVTVYNPQLEADNLIFHKENTYIVPLQQ